MLFVTYFVFSKSIYDGKHKRDLVYCIKRASKTSVVAVIIFLETNRIYWLLTSVCFFSIWVFFHKHSRFTGQQTKRKTTFLTPFYHFDSFHRHLEISRAVATESSLIRSMLLHFYIIKWYLTELARYFPKNNYSEIGCLSIGSNLIKVFRYRAFKELFVKKTFYLETKIIDFGKTKRWKLWLKN